MIVAGIDPGLDGAIALLEDGVATVHDMPTLTLARGAKSKREVDTHGLVRLLRSTAIDHAYVEAVAARPGQGVSSMFSFGRSLGIVIGVLAALDIPLSMASPVVWKRTLAVPKAKDAARARASQLLPRSAHLWPLKKHDGRAEACLIGLYGLRQSAPAAPAARADDHGKGGPRRSTRLPDGRP